MKRKKNGVPTIFIQKKKKERCPLMKEVKMKKVTPDSKPSLKKEKKKENEKERTFKTQKLNQKNCETNIKAKKKCPKTTALKKKEDLKTQCYK